MKFTHFFIDRPIFAAVLSIVITFIGIIAYFQLPVSQYPAVALPTIVVSASFPGATPDVVAQTVATPLEEQINGVEDMLYMESDSTSDGEMQLTITFKLGTDLDKAQVLVQNRVATAEPQLPQEVRQIGITTLKRSPDLLLVVNLLSPDNRFDQLYISNYAYLQVQDVLSRVEGVGDVHLFGARNYSMRIWLDAARLAEVNLTAGDVVQSIASTERRGCRWCGWTASHETSGSVSVFREHQRASSDSGRIRGYCSEIRGNWKSRAST